MPPPGYGGRQRSTLNLRRDTIFDVRLTPVTTEAAWRGDALGLTEDWVCMLSEAQIEELETLGARPVRRLKDGKEYSTDNGNAILDAHVGPLDDARSFDVHARAIPGVVDVGLFFDIASLVLVGGAGAVREL